MRALGIYRESEFSPGKVNADAAILDAVMAALRRRGIVAATMGPEEFVAAPIPEYDLVLAMCQSEAALARLAVVEERGALVVNPARSIRSCYRDRLGEALARAGAPVPPGCLTDTGTPPAAQALGGIDPARGIYVKRGDLHALSADDVTRVESARELAAALAGFARRGVRKAYLQEAVQGRVIKFYGVSGTYFTIAADGPAVEEAVAAELRLAAAAAADALELQVWGGDAVVEGRRFRIIDFNDWPSFGAVCNQAADAISHRALELMAARAAR